MEKSPSLLEYNGRNVKGSSLWVSRPVMCHPMLGDISELSANEQGMDIAIGFPLPSPVATEGRYSWTYAFVASSRLKYSTISGIS